MIQRQQTLWLLLAIVCSVLSFMFPFYTVYEANPIANSSGKYAELEAGSSFFLLILTGISIVIGGIAIFLFKDRQTQLKLTISGIVISVTLLIMYFIEIGKLPSGGNFALTCVFVILIPIGYIMATRGIWKDQKLVKSLDKLR